MNYIQNKLDELIETYRKENYSEYDVRMVAERLATDYHNHIVERIYNAPNDKINCLKQHIAGESIWLSKRDILNILQDTNQK